MQNVYSGVKINNEIELCEIMDGECKKNVEKALLQNRISYFIRWPKKSIFSRKSTCVICVHEDAKEKASEIIEGVCAESGYNVRFLLKRPKNNYL